jgi:hypothetical protein
METVWAKLSSETMYHESESPGRGDHGDAPSRSVAYI